MKNSCSTNRKRGTLFFLCLFKWASLGCLLTVWSGCGSAPEITAAQSYTRFADAIERGDYEEIEASVSKASLTRFDVWNAWILVGKREDLKMLPPFDRYIVLLSRMLHDNLSSAHWEALDNERKSKSRSYVVNTLMGETLAFLLTDFRVGELSYSGEVSGAPLFRGAIRFPVQARLVLEDGSWKVDATTMLSDLFQEEFRRVAGDQYRNRDRIAELMAILYGERFGEFLYSAPLESIRER